MFADWSDATTITACTAAAVALMTTIGGGFAWAVSTLLGHIKSAREAQQVHELQVLTKIEAMSAAFRADMAAKDLVLVALQKDTSRVISELSERVSQVGHAIDELRGRIGIGPGPWGNKPPQT